MRYPRNIKVDWYATMKEKYDKRLREKVNQDYYNTERRHRLSSTQEEDDEEMEVDEPKVRFRCLYHNSMVLFKRSV